jgi:hypothetical protein
MKAFLSLTTIGLILTFALRVPGQDTPSLKDTLQWMQNTLDSGAGSLYINTGKDGSVEKRELTMPDAKSCVVSFAYQTGPLEKNSYGIIDKPKFQQLEKFNLKDIDPTTVEAGKPIHTKAGDKPADAMGPYVSFSATTRDNAKLISAFMTLHPAPGAQESYTTESLIFELPYPYATRFTKAFKHAVLLCGGKPSSF